MAPVLSARMLEKQSYSHNTLERCNWNNPLPFVHASEVIRARMLHAVLSVKGSFEQQLLQVWAPVKHVDGYVLTSCGQPFAIDVWSPGLVQYRTLSLMYAFSLVGDGDGDLGLPGRVFMQKLPEWTPNVPTKSIPS